jgi:hypothetical protein
MRDYLRFREMLVSRDMTYCFDDEAETYEVYMWYGASRHHVVSVPARIARHDVAAARDLIDTARSLHTLFGP